MMAWCVDYSRRSCLSGPACRCSAPLSTGTDNAIYRLGPDYGIRLPRIGSAVGQIAKEAEWLPRLAPYVPTAVPEPVALGERDAAIRTRGLCTAGSKASTPWPARSPTGPASPGEVAAAMVALRGVETTGAPPAGHRGGPIAAVETATP